MGNASDVTKIGLFGGTFDPIHNAHLLIAECAREALGLDLVYFAPAAIPPHKQKGRIISPGPHRLAMLERAIEGNDHFASLAWELERQTVSYTVETLEYLQQHHEPSTLYLILGGDSLRDFPTWRDPERIGELAQIAAIQRPGHRLSADVAARFQYHEIPAPMMEISSTDIRERIQRGASVRYRLPDQVIDYIEQHGLYR